MLKYCVCLLSFGFGRCDFVSLFETSIFRVSKKNSLNLSCKKKRCGTKVRYNNMSSSRGSKTLFHQLIDVMISIALVGTKISLPFQLTSADRDSSCDQHNQTLEAKAVLLTMLR